MPSTNTDWLTLCTQPMEETILQGRKCRENYQRGRRRRLHGRTPAFGERIMTAFPTLMNDKWGNDEGSQSGPTIFTLNCRLTRRCTNSLSRNKQQTQRLTRRPTRRRINKRMKIAFFLLKRKKTFFILSCSLNTRWIVMLIWLAGYYRLFNLAGYKSIWPIRHLTDIGHLLIDVRLLPSHLLPRGQRQIRRRFP